MELEGCKADVVGAWNILFAMQRKLPIAFDEEAVSVTDVGLMFRSVRFGLDEAHGNGTAVQWNWHRGRGAIRGERARRLLERYGTSTLEIEGVVSRLQDIPVDIAPVFVAAGETMEGAGSPARATGP